jgi:hypothetical protein
MKKTATPMRVLVFAACLALLLNRPGRFSARAADGSSRVAPDAYSSCRTFTYKQYNCPAGCTDSTYWTYVDSGSGQDDADLNTDPCGEAKAGQSCSQPFALINQRQDCIDCCVQEYGACGEEPPTPDLCCCQTGSQYMVCMSSTGTCLPCLSVGQACGADTDCCTGHCNDVCCQMQGNCTSNADCCCWSGVECVDGKCIETGSPAQG